MLLESGYCLAYPVVRDITSLKLSEEKIRRLAYFDPLTRMPNRLHFIERVDRELLRARRENHRLALLFLDLDGFKRINDTLGHGAGDFPLQSVAELLREKLRASDIVERPGPDAFSLHFARLGGDEFTIVLSDVEDAAMVSLIAQRVQAVLSRPFQIEGKAITITASIGIAVFPEDGAMPRPCSSTRIPRCITPRPRAVTIGRCTPRH